MVSGADDVLDTAIAWLRQGMTVAVATVVRTWGSAPCPAGSQLVVNDACGFEGSVSGGCVEAATVEAALEVGASRRPRRLEFGVTDTEAWRVGLACGGHIEILVEALQGELELLERLRDDRKSRRAAVLATELTTGRHALIHPAEETPVEPALLEAAREAARRDASTLATVSGIEWFLHVRNPAPRMFVVGAVHVAQVLAPLAAGAGFEVVVLDPREAFATPARFPGITLSREWPDAGLRRLAPAARDAVIALTHDPKLDDPALTVALESDAFYVGALGSRRTQRARLARLATQGVPTSALARVHGPVGLDIGGRTPAEIATSILAGVIRALRKPRRRARVAAIVLAAGRSSRMGSVNKLTAELHGAPLVNRTVDAALASRAEPVIVVTGHAEEDVRRALAGRPIVFVHNPDHAHGLSTTLRAGLSALGTGFHGAVICLADMPGVNASHIDALVDGFEASGEKQVVVPVHAGRRGNPVLWPAECFDELARLTGDVGGRSLLDALGDRVQTVPVSDDGVLIDIDTEAELTAAAARALAR